MKKILAVFLVTFFLSSSIAYAFEITPIPKPTNLPGPEISTSTGSDINAAKSARKALAEQILPKYAVSLVGFVGVAALIFLIISGVRYGMSYGNEEAVEKAKNQVLYALVGFVIALLSYTIVSIVVNLKYEGNTSGGAAPAAQTPAP